MTVAAIEENQASEETKEYTRKIYQAKIPDDLSENRYISGMAALNLPAPEGTSGDWHFLSIYYCRDAKHVKFIKVAGEREYLNTNHIFKNYGIYKCGEILRKKGFNVEKGEPHAANHFRAILDLLYERIKEGKYPSYLYGSSEDYLDTEEEKCFLLEKAATMLPYLSIEEQEMLIRWIEKERVPGYKS